ncbi:hypothetical protein F7725_002330 [Dissostichus mawsoni]|uniref:PARP4 MVP-ID C-terminal domain-containing protein n=1 Tax=Dissostichus mawsoni TaxID=36200 RepID=A0A7J5Y396_DISMA|nr:hypothetical protein F7725_002330 [Dissostichus mawsoni]
MMMMNDRAPEPPVTGKAFSFRNAMSYSAHSLQRQSTSPDPPAPPPPTLGSAPPLAESLLGTNAMPDQVSEQMESQALRIRALSPSYQTGTSSGLWSGLQSSLSCPTFPGAMNIHVGAFDLDTTTECATESPVKGQSGGFSRSAASLFSTAQLLFSDDKKWQALVSGLSLEEEPVRQDQPMKDAPPVPLDEASGVHVKRRMHKFRGRALAMPEEDDPSCGSSWGGLLRGKCLFKSSRMRQSADQPFERKSADPEALKLRWTEIFQMQHSEGYWQFTAELGELINLDVDLFANVFLKNKGIQSLGVKAHADILKLVATLLVLQLMREEKIEEGKLLRTLFCLDDSPLPRPERWEEVKRAVDWVCWADRQYPCVYSRLEFGFSWESSTRQLLGFEGLPPFSALRGLNLQKTVPQVLVH